MRRAHVQASTRWYGSLRLPDGRLQFVEARTLPRPQTAIAHPEAEGHPETAYEIMTDPERASWPSR
jgi:hypothetical protein